MVTRCRIIGPLLVTLVVVAPASAQVTKLEIVARESPALAGAAFGTAGQYEKIRGWVHGEVDPADPRNAIITDLSLAPRNARGRVEYAAEFVLLKPVDMSRSNGVLRYIAPNRGWPYPDADPLFLGAGTVFLWGAWQGDVPEDARRLMLQVPVATHPDGRAITGPVRVEFVGQPGQPRPEMPLQGNVFNRDQMPYPPASLDNTGAVLTKRVKETDPRLFVPNDRWAFATCGASGTFPGTPDPGMVCLAGGFESKYLYELIYEARGPRVMGLGLAAIRDMVSFFRRRTRDDDGKANPLGAAVRHAMGAGVSQAGNLMKTFVHLGFNEDLHGRRVFDAVFPLVAARQTNVNMRFAVPGGGGGVRADHRAFGQSAVRAFAPDYHDDIRARTGGLLERCAANRTCPRVFLGLSGAEMWGLQGSPVLTDAYGTRDLEQPDEVRIYYFAGTQHGTSPTAWDPAVTVYPAGVRSEFDEIVRALWVRLTEWVIDGRPPPDSRVPSLAQGTLVRPEDLRYPAMRGVSFPVKGADAPLPDFEYLGWYTTLGLLDFGPRFEEADESGIADWLPPAYMGKDYAILVSAIDADGNEVAGIPPIGNAVPLGTNLPYNYRADLALGDLAGLGGAFIPFHRTRAARLAAGDERRSLEERYESHEGYVEAVRKAAERLVAEGFLLPEDAARVVREADAAEALR